jgi:hypothetical protein
MQPRMAERSIHENGVVEVFERLYSRFFEGNEESIFRKQNAYGRLSFLNMASNFSNRKARSETPLGATP